jgi:hypothetical protein
VSEPSLGELLERVLERLEKLRDELRPVTLDVGTVCGKCRPVYANGRFVGRMQCEECGK